MNPFLFVAAMLACVYLGISFWRVVGFMMIIMTLNILRNAKKPEGKPSIWYQLRFVPALLGATSFWLGG